MAMTFPAWISDSLQNKEVGEPMSPDIDADTGLDDRFAEPGDFLSLLRRSVDGRCRLVVTRQASRPSVVAQLFLQQ